MNALSGIPLSVLDLAPVPEGSTPADALRNSVELARHVERLGYKRVWLAEHHNMPGIASAATAVVIGHVAGATSTIRVGSGGIMLPNHAPLVIAEQFGTLETLYPGRIDLALGRAPGTDGPTMRALRRDLKSSGDDFPELLEELRYYLRPAAPGQPVRAVPGAGLSHIPVWLLGSGDFSARLAGELGLPFGSAGHFSPDNLLPALDLYRRVFRPSEVLEKPYALACINIFAAESDRAAERLATSHWQAHLRLRRGMPGLLPPPVDSIKDLGLPYENALTDSFLRGSIIGGPDSVREQLEAFALVTGADEIMVHSMIYDHEARLRSYEIVMEAAREAARAA